MFSLALRSVRHRPGRFAATLLSAFLGAVIVMSFDSLYDTAAQAGVDDTSAETLTTSASVVGGYGTLLVFFAIASTLTVNVRQRAVELSLLRSCGATPAQIKRMVVGEAVLIGVVASLLAIGPAVLGGRALVGAFQDTEQVAHGVDPVFGPVAAGSGAAVTVLASTGAAFLAVRRATRQHAGGRRPRGRLRTVGGTAALVLGGCSASATFAFDTTDPALMALPAYGAILLSIGFATFAPALLRAALAVLTRPLTALTGASGYLTVHNLRQRAGDLSAVLMPLILFIGVATATLSMQAVENDAVASSGLARSVDDKNLATLNLIVVGVIVVFACIMLINSLYAATVHRRREFGGQRLAGATPGQVLTMVGAESAVLTVTGVVAGTIAALAGLVPFTAVRADGALPGQGPWIWAATVAVAGAATFGTGLATTRRVLRAPAVEAVAVAA